MSQDNRHILWSPDDHPSIELLRQHQGGALPPALRHQLENHLLGCELCSDIVTGMALSNPAKTRAAVRHINQVVAAKTKKKKRRALPVYLTDWRVAAAILLVLCSTLLVFLYNYKELRKQLEITEARESDQTIQDAMDLSETTLEEPQADNLAVIVPDTIKQKKETAVQKLKRPMSVVQPPLGVAKEAKDISLPENKTDQVLAFADEDVNKSLEEVTVTPKRENKSLDLSGYTESLNLQNKQVAAATPPAVTKALAGSVAGVQVRRKGSVATNQIQGQVLSDDGQPLPGVTVMVKGTTNGVSTDASGNFSLTLPSDRATLSFRYIGFETQEQAVTASNEALTVNMKTDTRSLSEVVVTGLGTAKSETSPPRIVAAKPRIGQRAYKNYLEENIRYSDDSKKGRVVVRATVMPTGGLQNIRVSKSLCPSCDKEALRLVESGPGWQAATQDGNAIEQEVRIVIRFRPDTKN